MYVGMYIRNIYIVYKVTYIHCILYLFLYLYALAVIGLHLLGDSGVHTTPSIVTNTTTLPPIVSTAVTTTETTKSVITVVQSGSQTSVDWLDEKNLPILIGISVAIFVLLIIVIVLIAWTFSRRIKSGT